MKDSMRKTIQEISQTPGITWKDILPAFYAGNAVFEYIEGALVSIATAQITKGENVCPVVRAEFTGKYIEKSFTESLESFRALISDIPEIFFSDMGDRASKNNYANDAAVVYTSFSKQHATIKISTNDMVLIQSVRDWVNANLTEEDSAGTVYVLTATSAGLQFEPMGDGGAELIRDNYASEVLVAFDRLKEELVAKPPHGRLSILEGPPGSGKCLGVGTPVMKYNGDVVPVESIVAGDDLLGPDGQARRVLSVNTGSGELFRIVPAAGQSWQSWVCNDVHILTLRNAAGNIVDIPLNEYLQQNDEYKASYKMFRQPISFPDRNLHAIEEVEFGVIAIGAGDYYGFTLDGDGRFLLGDFTVTHNTHLIKALLTDLAKDVTFVLVQSTLVEQLVGPTGISTIMQFRTENPHRPLVFVLEDADIVLAPRDGGNMSLISSLLNMGDGIIGSTLDIRIVATTNATQMQLDDAVKRPGRLTVLEHVGSLPEEQATGILRRLTGDESLKATGKMTLAEIYQKAYDQGFKGAPAKKERKMGFGS